MYEGGNETVPLFFLTSSQNLAWPGNKFKIQMVVAAAAKFLIWNLGKYGTTAARPDPTLDKKLDSELQGIRRDEGRSGWVARGGR